MQVKKRNHWYVVTKINQYSVASQNLSIKWCHHSPTHNQWFYEQNPTVSRKSRLHYNGHHYVGKLKSEHKMLEKWLQMDWRVSIMCQLWHHNKDLRLGNNEPSLFLKLLEHIVSLPLHTWHLQELISIQKDLVFKMHSPKFTFFFGKKRPSTMIIWTSKHGNASVVTLYHHGTTTWSPSEIFHFYSSLHIGHYPQDVAAGKGQPH